MRKVLEKIRVVSLLVLFLAFGCSQGGNDQMDDQDPQPDSNLNKKSVGDSANDILSNVKYDDIIIELVAVNGYQLDNSVINDFKSFLQTLVQKPGGITVSTSTVAPPGLAPYSLNDLISFEDQNRTGYNQNRELAIFMFITEDAYTNENVLGLAYRNTSFALMGGRIRELTGGIGQPSENLVLQTVLRHEMGHLLGLVNVGTPMQTDHQDTDNGHHCDVEDCLMYYAVETSDFLSNIINNNSPPELDVQCRADLTANGGK
ncbi:peptidase [Reichenbachiella sp. MALMAid0571]|uniref:peptidase n=1 Tax=Reichenbachiella sp. MALMAid0571 TaxID=3143939 RepID=UPI0032E050C2